MVDEVYVMVFVRYKGTFCFSKSFVDEFIIYLNYDNRTALYHCTKEDYIKVRQSILNEIGYPITEIQLIKPKR